MLFDGLWGAATKLALMIASAMVVVCVGNLTLLGFISMQQRRSI